MTDVAESRADGSYISEDVLRLAVRHVLIDGVETELADVGFGTRLDDLELDSLLLAELIVQLEEELGVLLDLALSDRLDTLGDFCSALRPVGPSA